MKFFFQKNRELTAILLILIGLIFFYHLITAWRGFGQYRDQHLGTALHYAATKFDLQHTIIVGFNATNIPTIQELPIWQVITGLAFKYFGTWFGWANIVSLLLFLNCLYPLFRIAQKFYGDRVAWWTLIFFLSQGLIFIYAGLAGADGFCLSVSIWFWFACCKLMEYPVKWFLPAGALGALAAVSKMPFFMSVGLASFFILLNVRGFKLRYLAALAGVGIASGILFLLWTHYTDAAQKNAEFPLIDLRLSNPDMVVWWFGDWHYRLNPANWVKAGWRFASVIFGSFSLIVLFVLAFCNRQIHPAAKFYFIAPIFSTLIFTHVVLAHFHYYMMFSPAVAILCAAALVKIETFLSSHNFSTRLVTLTATAIIFLALFQGLMAMRAFSFDKFPIAITAAIRDHTTPQDKLVVINGGWGGDELIRADRNGLSMFPWNMKILEIPKSYARLKELGFDKLVIVSESPFQNAIQVVNPGETGIQRVMAKSFLTPQIENWPTVYATENIIIKKMP
jgi:hypothetical protein